MGSSTLNVRSPVTQSSIELSSMGSGHITLAVQSNKVTALLQGSSVIDISGVAQSAEITSQGAGQLHGAQLQIGTAQVAVMGSGLVEIAVTAVVSGSVMGAGLLRLKGQAMQEQVQTIGAGRVEHF